VAAIKSGLKAFGYGILVLVVGSIIGFLSSAYLEVWFDTVDGFEAGNPSTWGKLASGLAAKVDFTSPRLYRVYYGENVRDGETKLSTADVKIKNFGLTSRLGGTKAKEDNRIFDLLGFANSDHLVLVQRSPDAGVGSFWFSNTRADDNKLFYFGYFMTEDYKRSPETDLWITQCPVVMMSKELADRSYPKADDARTAFAFLRTKCVEFKLQTSMNTELVTK
jgi:hypothetical protein